MKGIIFEINKRKAVALDNEGRFVNLKNKGYTVGDEVELGYAHSQANWSRRRFATALTAIVIVLILAIGGTFGGLYYDANYKTAYTVQMDINPSVILFLNSKDIVIKAEGNNADGELLRPNELKGETLDGFIQKYVERFIESDMFDNETEYIVKIVVDGKTKATADTKAISTKVENIVRKDFEEKGISVATETENGVKDAEPKNVEPTTWTYSYYNKLLSDAALGTEKLYDGEKMTIPSEPSNNGTGYNFAFWWDGSTMDKEGKKPVDFFVGGERIISADTTLYAVWTYYEGYTVDGKQWLIEPQTVFVKFILVYAGLADYVMAEGEFLRENLLKIAPTVTDMNDKLKENGVNPKDANFIFWSLTKDGSAGDYFEKNPPVTGDIVLYSVFK